MTVESRDVTCRLPDTTILRCVNYEPAECRAEGGQSVSLTHRRSCGHRGDANLINFGPTPRKKRQNKNERPESRTSPQRQDDEKRCSKPKEVSSTSASGVCEFRSPYPHPGLYLKGRGSNAVRAKDACRVSTSWSARFSARNGYINLRNENKRGHGSRRGTLISTTTPSPGLPRSLDRAHPSTAGEFRCDSR